MVAECVLGDVPVSSVRVSGWCAHHCRLVTTLVPGGTLCTHYNTTHLRSSVTEQTGKWTQCPTTELLERLSSCDNCSSCYYREGTSGSAWLDQWVSSYWPEKTIKQHTSIPLYSYSETYNMSRIFKKFVWDEVNRNLSAEVSGSA